MPPIIEDITYADGVSAWLVQPNRARGGPGAGVVFWHWFSQEPLGDRNQFLMEARELAARDTPAAAVVGNTRAGDPGTITIV